MSKSNASVDISDGIEYENPIPQMIPVTIDAEPNIPAMDAYSGSTHLKVYHKMFINSIRQNVEKHWSQVRNKYEYGTYELCINYIT